MDYTVLRPALANLKSTLIGWGVVFVLLAIPVCNASVHAFVPPKKLNSTEQQPAALNQPQLTLKARVKTNVQQPVKPVQAPPAKPKPAATARLATATAGNPYTWYNCTWYAKSKRPDLPNTLGNANTWVIRARSQGLPTGITPKDGAIGQKGMHVVYVEHVNPDGTMVITERNYVAHLAFSRRVISPVGWQFIY
jgi:surface antigen